MVSRRGAPVNFASIGSNQIIGGGSGYGSSSNLGAANKGNDNFVSSHAAQQADSFFAKYGYHR